VFRRVTASSAREERQFLERRVAESKKDLDLTSQQLRDFEEKNRIIDLPEQSKAVVSAMATLQGEVMTKQLQLSYVNSFSANDEATTDQLRQQLAVMETKMRSLETVEPDSKAAASTRDRRSSLFPAALSVPKLRFELMELYRQQKIQETVFFLLTQRHEMAKVNEARDTSTFQIIDHAVVPMKKSRPHRSVIVLAGFAASLAVAAAWLRWLTLRRQSGLPENTPGMSLSA
jgi:capsule polysaccharide export protein KpsE/RkpR